MPVHRQKKDTTPTAPGSTPEQAAPALPDQQTFQQFLRELARNAIRVVVEGVMREELDALIGVGWGECSPKRKGYRNGSYTRDLVTSSGRLEEINVPRDRAGQFHTQVFDRYSRYEPQVAQGLTEMFVAGVSTHKVGEVVHCSTKNLTRRFVQQASRNSWLSSLQASLARAMVYEALLLVTAPQRCASRVDTDLAHTAL